MITTGKNFGHYKIREKIGAGGMGEVFLAEDTRLRRPVALKVLPENIASDKDRLRRFEREAHSASALNHPNILTIFEFGADGETHFLAAEFVKGETLRDRLKRDRLTLSETLDITIQIASALQAAHKTGIIHRDIKPENVMIREDGYVKVLDFGLAKFLEQTALDAEAETIIEAQTQAGMILGTAAYMSPEQARGQSVDARTDIFSLGAVLYELLTRRQPFTGETINHTIVAILEKEPQPLSQSEKDFPAEIERIVFKTLAKDKDKRYESAKELLTDLKSLQKRLEFEAELGRDGETRRRGEGENATKIQPSPFLPVSASAHLNSIAVLPFANMSADADNEYFCDGLAEELLNALAKIEDLKVAARTSAFSFKGKNVEVSEIGNVLNVRTVLEGSVRKSGSKLRITVQLINASDGYHLWSERYDREMRDIFEVQDEITLAVVDALKVNLLGEEKKAVLKRYTDNNAAYLEYLRGRYFWNKRDAKSFQKAIRHFKTAIDIDPTFALAYAGLADTYSILPIWGAGAAHDFYPRARAAALRALEIDENLAEAHASLGYVKYLYDWDFAGVEKSYRRAIELNPHYATVRAWLGKFLVVTRRFDEALTEMKRADELDPLAPQVGAAFGGLYLYSRQYDKAIEQYGRVLAENPNLIPALFGIGTAYAQKGMFAEAIAAHEKAVEQSGENPVLVGTLAGTRAMAGECEAARKTIEKLKLEYEKCEMLSYSIATVYALLNEKQAAFEWLEKAYAQRNSQLPDLDIDPEFDNLRDDSRFENLRRRVGLPQ